MEFSVHRFQDGKLAIHIAQAAFIFVAWVIEIAVFRSSANIDGKLGWLFGLCFLTVPALIYLTMTPRFSRAHKFANPYAFATVDFVFTILWLSAFAAQASFNSAGKCGSGCHLSKIIVGLGVFIWLFFALTTAMSVYGVIYHRNNGYLPGASRAPNNAQMIDPHKEAFSTAPPDDEYARIQTADHEAEGYNGEPSIEPRYDTPYGGGRYMPPQVHDEGSTAYTGYGGAENAVPSGGRAQYPPGNYNINV